jgi:myo-inositol-1(or 4)-monophosphatase
MSTTNRNFGDDAESAMQIARQAAALALEFFNRRDELIAETKKSPHDLVSEADAKVEEFIKNTLAKTFPQDGFLGEESGGQIDHSTWIVDPIDGTTNFLSGLPMWGVSLGLVVDGDPKVGIIILPALGLEYLAIKGHGATCNGKKISVSDNRDIERAIVIFGRSPHLPHDGPLKLAAEMMEKGALLYAFGCCVYNVTCVASGSCDLYVEQRVYPWDGAAASLIVREAGGTANFVLTEDSIVNGYSITAASHDGWLSA